MTISSPRLVLAALLAAAASTSVDAATLRKAKLSRAETASPTSADEVEASIVEYHRSLMEPTEGDMDMDDMDMDDMDMGMDTGNHNHKMFKPLSCNHMIDWEVECAPGTASSLSDLAVAAAGGQVTIPCGSCALADAVDGSLLEIPGGLNVEGRLHFPTGASVTIRTTSVAVQGIFSSELPMAGTTIPATDGSGVKIILYGKDDIMFEPHVENAMACGGNMTHPQACNVGKKAFVVAGGKLDVKAIDPQCPSWEHLLDTSSSQTPPAMPTPGPKPEPLPICSRAILDVNYKVGDAHTGGTFGGQGAVFPKDDAATSPGDDAYLSHYNRGSWIHGPKFLVDPNCVVPNADYIMTGRARFRSAKADGTASKCTIEGGKHTGHCLEYKILNRPGYPFLGRMQGKQSNFIHEGEWFDFAISLKPMSKAIINKDAGMLQTWFWRVEDNVIIDIDWLKVELPAEMSLPENDETGCLDLVFGNGDAEQNGISTWPWHNSNGGNYLHIAEETDPVSGELNHFYRQERMGAWWGMWYKHHGFKTPCVQGEVDYKFKLRWRYNSDTPRGLSLRFGWVKSGKWSWKFLGNCPISSNADGWVDCEKTMRAPADAEGADGYQIWNFIGGEGSAPYPTIDFDELSFARSYDPPAMPQDIIYVSPEAASCWAPGSELLLTSATTNQYDAHKVVVRSSDPVTGKVTLETAVPHTTTKVDDNEFPVEVMQLIRNFKMEAEADPTDDELHGAHMIILHTPNVAQTLEGVEIKGFGQQGNLGRYPIHFHMCEAVEGSLISRNVIKHSHQRGIVLHGSHNVTVSNNVLYEIKGHGYILEDGVEQHNRFYDNIGAVFRPVERLVPSGSTESDNQPSVYWMANTMNTWEGNVAAGGHIGFWIELGLGHVRGASADIHPEMDRLTLPLLKFKDNDAHSSSFCGMSNYPNRYTPSEEAVIENLRVYRNNNCGILFHVNNKMRMKGGVAADNRFRQVWNQLAENISLEGTRLLGARPEFKAAMLRAGHGVHCDGNGVMEGVTYSINRIFGGTKGLTLTDVHFDNFDCGTSSIAIQAEPRRVDNGGVYDAVTTINGVTFGPNVPEVSKVSTCGVEALGVDTVALEDTNGDISPSGTPGFLVSNKETTKTLAGGACTPLEGTCLSYCDDVCLQTFKILTNAMATDVEMVISDGTSTTTVGRRTSGDLTFTFSKGSYGVSLPAGTFDISFRDASGATVFPDFVLPGMEAEPLCTKGETILNIIKPAPTPERCDELIRTGDFEEGSIHGWKQFFTGLELASPGAGGSAHALKTTSRRLWNAMITKYLDMSCLVEGDTYDVKVSYKVLDANGIGIDCGTKCPTVSLAYYNPAQRWMNIGRTDYDTYDVNGWNTISGQFTVPNVSSWDNVHISMSDSGHTFSGQFIVDNWTVTKVTSSA